MIKPIHKKAGGGKAMLYHSTRGLAPEIDSAEAVLRGLAPDGGLYLPKEMPVLDWKACVQAPVLEMARMLLEKPVL